MCRLPRRLTHDEINDDVAENRSNNRHGWCRHILHYTAVSIASSNRLGGNRCPRRTRYDDPLCRGVPLVAALPRFKKPLPMNRREIDAVKAFQQETRGDNLTEADTGHSATLKVKLNRPPTSMDAVLAIANR